MTLEEIIQKAKEDEAFRKQVVLWAKDTEEGKEVLNNFAKIEIEKKIKEETGNLYTGIDNDIFEILGVRKKNDQKTYDFIKEVVSEFKKLKEDKGGDKDEKIKELAAKLKAAEEGGVSNEHWKKIYNEALESWTAKEEGYKKDLTDKEQEFLVAQVRADLTSGITGLKIKADIPKEAVDAMVKMQEEEILKSAKLIDGKVIYHKEDGTPWMNSEYKPISSTEIWGDKLKGIIDTGNGGSGTGGGATTKIDGGKVEKTGEGDNAKTKLVLNKELFSTKVEFQKLAETTLRKQGILVGSKEFTEAMDRAYEEYGVSELNLQ